MDQAPVKVDRTPLYILGYNSGPNGFNVPYEEHDYLYPDTCTGSANEGSDNPEWPAEFAILRDNTPIFEFETGGFTMLPMYEYLVYVKAKEYRTPVELDFYTSYIYPARSRFYDYNEIYDSRARYLSKQCDFVLEEIYDSLEAGG